MYVLELFKKLDSEKIIEEMVSQPYFFEEIDYNNRISDEEKLEAKSYYKQLCMDEINKIKECEYERSAEEILFVSTSIGNDGALGIYMMNTNNIDTVKSAFEFESLDDFKNPLYGITFTKRSDILKMTLMRENIEKYGEYKVAALILRECLTFKLDEEERNDFIDLVMTQMNEMDDESFEDCKTADELFEELRKEFGFEKHEETEEEKREREEEFINNISKDIKLLKEDVMSIIDNLNY